MSNPDSGINSVYAGVVAGIVFISIFVCIAYFNTSETSSITLALFIMPAVGFILSSVTNIVSQSISCGTTNIGKAFMGGVPSIGTTLFAFLLAYFNKCRIPVASVFAPLFVSNITSSNSSSPVLLETVERDYPSVKTASYSFYLFVSIIFGIVIGNSVSAIC